MVRTLEIMQEQPYFVVVLAHSLHGRLRRVQIPHKAIYTVLVFALVGFLTVFGFLCSYMRMTWKVANYNALRHEVDAVRKKYKELQRQNRQQTEQLASLQLFASEVTISFGLDGKPISHTGRDAAPLTPTYAESLEEYSTLQAAVFSPHDDGFRKQWLVNTRPSLWPVYGRLMSSFGGRSDPFSGEGAWHKGVDLSAPRGTPVHATADGIVVHASWGGSYGNLVVIDHGNGMQTYYAHLSRFAVLPGQEIRRGEVLGYSGATGRATAPHLHYEVRVGGNPVNPYKYLSHSQMTMATPIAHSDLPF